MANPFLVLGGVAVGVITAGIGVLAVPGWIDSAHDSAAMNDLGNIRGAESAAILQLGSYTDDFAVLESGELGVKFQKSDTVKIVGLKADSNESWCSAVLSKSGKYFATSSDTARFATGRGAAGAMLTAGCDPDLVDAIIADPIDGVDVGDSTDPGHWVGEPETPSNGSGPGGDDGETTGPTPAKTAYGVTGEVQQVAYTNHGIYVFDGNRSIYRIDNAGVASKVTITGDAAGRRFGASAVMKSNGGDAVYISAQINDYDTGEMWAIYRINADGSSTKITSGNADGYGGSTTIYSYTVSPSGKVIISGTNDYWDTGMDWWNNVYGLWELNEGTHKSTLIKANDPGFDPIAVDIEADAAGNIYFVADGSAFNYGVVKVSPGGAVTHYATESPAGGPFNPGHLALGADGTLYAQNISDAGGALYRVNTNTGALTAVSTWDDAGSWFTTQTAAFGSSGEVYFVSGVDVVKLSGGERTFVIDSTPAG